MSMRCRYLGIYLFSFQRPFVTTSMRCTPRQKTASGIAVVAAVAAVSYVVRDVRRVELLEPLNAPTCWPTDTFHDNILTLVTISVGLDQEYRACMRKNRRAYARLHNYAYCDFDAPLVTAHRSFSFQKMVAIAHLLNRGSKAVWYLDADAIVVNKSLALHTLLGNATGDIIWASEAEGMKIRELRILMNGLNMKSTPADGEPSWTIQGGSFVVRDTAWARWALQTVYQQGGSALMPWDWTRLSDRAQWVKFAYRSTDAHAHMTVVPSRLMDSMKWEYEPGDLVYHEAGGGAYGLSLGKRKYGTLLQRCRQIEGNNS